MSNDIYRVHSHTLLHFPLFLSHSLLLPLPLPLPLPFHLHRMLWKFAEDHPADVEAVYFLSGTLANSRNSVIKLVPAVKLDATKKLYSHLSSVHVHSLFKKITSQATQEVRFHYLFIRLVICFLENKEHAHQIQTYD